jgi:hypothetical protein
LIGLLIAFFNLLCSANAQSGCGVSKQTSHNATWYEQIKNPCFFVQFNHSSYSLFKKRLSRALNILVKRIRKGSNRRR